MNATWQLVSSNPPSGGVAVILLRGEIDDAFAALDIAPLRAGEVALRRIADSDTGVVARFGEALAMLFPHAGAAVLRRLTTALTAAGVGGDSSDDPVARYPEARDEHEARMLAALSRAASPLAIDLLLDQPRRRAEGEPVMPAAVSRQLRRLITPPLVLALGAPNIGKSSLVNALAGRGVSIVADQPGTTRDHVGVNIDLAGLVVRWIDAPGIAPAAPEPADSEEAIQALAQNLALALVPAADLILLCGDLASGFLTNPCPGVTSLKLALRSDLGLPREPHDIATSALRGLGLDQLVAVIKEALVPASALADTRCWEFWERPT